MSTTKEKINNITPDWIRSEMADNAIPNPRQLSIDAGVRYESLTLALNGKRPLSKDIKSTLYWYFLYKSYIRHAKENED